jgi:hypothetical protein
MANGLSNLLTSPLEVDPVYFVQNRRTIDGNPFIIQNNGRDYLVDFYRHLCITALRDKRPVVVLKGRQVEMTEAALNVALYFMCNFKYFNVLHAFPTRDQVGRFSKERLQGALRTGKGLSNFLGDHKNSSDTISMVEFKNQNFYYMYSAWAEADSLRGLSVDALLRDEFQDWSDSAIANTDASTSQSKYAVEFSFGTPKNAGQPFERIWELSDQRYFHSRCVKCNKLFQITMDNFIHGTIVKCDNPNCRHEQTKEDANRRGQWIPTRSVGKEGRIGFHISQLLHPNIEKEQITRRKVEYSDSKFKNEVMGEFFTGGALPINEKDFIDRCCMPYKDVDFPSMIVPPNQTFLGIDWGGRNENNDKGAYTVATVISKQGDKYKVEKTELLLSADFQKQVGRIKEIIRMYNVISCVADIGFGQVQCQMLQQEYGPMVKSCYYAPNSKSKLSYNEENWMLTIDRNAYLEEIIDIINRGQLIMPWRKPTEWFVKHICNTELKLSHRTGNVFRSFEKNDSRRPNDALHSLNYAYIASIMHLGSNSIGRSAANSNHQASIKGGMTMANFNGRRANQNQMPGVPNIYR